MAAGHPISAAAGADALRAGGNAVDGALGAMLASFVCEPLLTGLGAGGHMLVAPPGESPVLLDFFVESPGRGRGAATDRTPRRDRGEPAQLIPVPVSFGDAVQTFNAGPASVGTYGVPAGVCEAARRFGRLELVQLTEPAARLARDGVALTREQAYVVEILSGIVTLTPEASALFAPGGQLLREGDRLRQPELAEALQRLGREGAQPFYQGDIAEAIADWIGARGGLLGAADLAAYEVVDRTPLDVAFRGRRVLINPPPSAGGLLIARALATLEAAGPAATPPAAPVLVEVMEEIQGERTAGFLDGLDDPGFAARFLGRPVSRLGSTTHIAAMDRDGWACSVTCSCGSSSGVIVPGTGVHLNNMLGEQDLNPTGFHRHPPGRRLPSMMAPAIVRRDGVAELALGSAGSNRIRSAILQTIIRVLDDGLDAQAAVDAPRVHWEDGVVYCEPGIDPAPLIEAGRTVVPFARRNLFFGGAQAVVRGSDGGFSGGGDPRRGGAAVVVEDG